MRVNCQMNKVIHIPESAHWEKVTNLLLKAGIKYAPSCNEVNARSGINTLTFNRECMWLTTQGTNPNEVLMGQNEIDQLALLEHSPEALLEWLFNL